MLQQAHTHNYMVPQNFQVQNFNVVWLILIIDDVKIHGVLFTSNYDDNVITDICEGFKTYSIYLRIFFSIL